MKFFTPKFLIKRNSGFALVEVLISVLVLAIGLLGLAGLHASGFRNSHGAFVRTQATFAVNDLADRMRANRPAAIAGNYVVAAVPADPNQIFAPTANPTFDCIANFTNTNIAGLCDPADMATADLVAWYAFLSNAIPGGNATVTCNPVGCGLNAIHTITVTWAGNQSVDNAALAAPLQTVVASFRP